MRNRFGSLLDRRHQLTAEGRLIDAAMHLSEHTHEAPLLLFCCGKRDWPFVVPAEARAGLATPSYGSIYPCVQYILLACRGL